MHNYIILQSSLVWQFKARAKTQKSQLEILEVFG